MNIQFDQEESHMPEGVNLYQQVSHRASLHLSAAYGVFWTSKIPIQAVRKLNTGTGIKSRSNENWGDVVLRQLQK